MGDENKRHVMSGACSTYKEQERIYMVFVGRPNGKRQLERPRQRWEYNIKMGHQELRWGGGGGTGLIYLG